jgi:hypothetical protein
MIFAIPRAGITYFGTTDTNYSGSLDDIKVEEDDIDYLLAAVNGMFPDVQLKKEDIKSSWAGLRPLIHQEGKSPSELSRKDEIFVSEEGLISIAGGKLTGYRKMAERVVDKVMQSLKAKKLLKIFSKSSTKNLKLNACAFKDEAHLLEFKASLEKFLAVYFPTTKSNGRVAERISSRLRRTNDRSVLLVHEDHEDDENAEIGVPLYTPNVAGDLELSSSKAYADHLLDNYGLNAYKILDYLKNLIIETQDNTSLTLILALNYSAKWELKMAIKSIAHAINTGTLTTNEITDDLVSKHLSTKGIPDPELLIRTSGERRISNFLLWQIAYAELYFTDTHWPDFRRNDLISAVIEYQN